MTDETREAVLNALAKARHALNEAERLLDHQPPPRGEIPLDDIPRRPLRSSPAFMVLGIVVLFVFVVLANIWWIRHTWN